MATVRDICDTDYAYSTGNTEIESTTTLHDLRGQLDRLEVRVVRGREEDLVAVLLGDPPHLHLEQRLLELVGAGVRCLVDVDQAISEILLSRKFFRALV